MARELVFDTETTGLDPSKHRVVNFALIELVDTVPTGVFMHSYLNPERDSEPHALAIHGLTTEFLSSKPKFQTIAASLLDFINGDPLVIHNSPFDLGFLRAEIARSGRMNATFKSYCTLDRARKIYGSGKNRLDDLVIRFGIPNLRAATGLHGALVDSLLLVNVYQYLRGVPLTPLTPEFLRKYGIGNEGKQSTTGQGATGADKAVSRALSGSSGQGVRGAGQTVGRHDSISNPPANGVAAAGLPASGDAPSDLGSDSVGGSNGGT